MVLTVVRAVIATVGLALRGLVLPASGKQAATIHLDYYAAVAAITPVLLVAGPVELAVIRSPAAVWGIPSFAIPAVGGGASSLVVLANHKSTPATLWLTMWGMAATIISSPGSPTAESQGKRRVIAARGAAGLL